ncbi:hypothetical protein FACS1894137_04710 [Spirochaetia bacterium]|nr:hypothetical protein FACS1894137_04710 [Spirochaetia bacterium]
MVSDVPVGMFLSGGYDSSVVTALLQANRTGKIKTFTIGFHEEKYNEAQYAKKIADYLGTDHTEYYCTEKDVLDIFPLLPEIWDEPFGDSSAVPTTLVSRVARKDVTVSLSADGGDEIFGGYDKYTTVYKYKRFLQKTPSCFHGFLKYILRNSTTHFTAEKLGIRNPQRRLERFSYMLGCNDAVILSLGSSQWLTSELQTLFKENYKPVLTAYDDNLGSGTWLDNLLALDYKTYQIDDILTKVDRATMSVSLEGREPLLDYRIIEYVARLPDSLKIRHNRDKKYLLKQIAYKYIPAPLLDRPKRGFGIPINRWFNNDEKLKDYFLYYLDKERLIKEDIFNIDIISAIMKQYLANKTEFTPLWYILIFEIWKEKWNVNG